MNTSRRKILKQLSYGLALSTVGISSLTLSACSTPETNKVKVISTKASTLPHGGISICQQQTNGKEIISLMNLTDQPVLLNASSPVSLEQINGSLIVKLNPAEKDGLTIQAGERFSFNIEARNQPQPYNELQISTAGKGQLTISSDHPAFNGHIAVMGLQAAA